jgi:hypothetical protein
VDDQEDSDLDGQDEGPLGPDRREPAPAPWSMPRPGTPEYRALVVQSMNGSVRAWDRWRAMLAGEIDQPAFMVDGELERVRTDEETERLMWLHAQSVIGSLAHLARLDRKAAGDRDPGPHHSDVLEFVADQLLCALYGHPPRLFRKPVGNRTGAKERNCIAFAKFYEEFAGNGKAPGHTARDGTRLLPDDDATAEICRAYDLTPAAYKAARDKLGPSDTVIFHWFHPWAFRYELGELPPTSGWATPANGSRGSGPPTGGPGPTASPASRGDPGPRPWNPGRPPGRGASGGRAKSRAASFHTTWLIV